MHSTLVQFKNAIKNYFLQSSLHGFHFIADKRFHWSERVFWAICVALSWGASIKLMLLSINEYEHKSIAFTVDASYLNWTTNFPAVIFCEKNNKKVNQFAPEWFGKNYSYDKKLMLVDVVFFRSTLHNTHACNKGVINREEKCVMDNYTFYTNAIRSTCEELFTVCEWNGIPFNCCQKFKPIETVYGVCYGINSFSIRSNKVEENLKINRKQNGGAGSLSIEVTNSDMMIYVLSNEEIPGYKSGRSVLFNSDIVKMRENKLFEIFLSVKEVANDDYVRSIEADRRGCKFPDENDLIFSNIYSHSACETQCFNNLQKEMCNCVLHLMPGAEFQKVCNLDGLLCIIVNFQQLIEKSSECDCVSSCIESDVNILLTKISTFKRFADEGSVNKFIIYIQAPNIRYLRTVVKTFLDMIVFTGGIIALFVGSSWLAVVEFFYYILIRPFGIKTSKREPKFKIKLKKYKTTQLPFVN